MSRAGVEPWLRETLQEIDPLRRQVLHALELTEEDVATWCAPLSAEELEARLFGLPPVAFHLRHIARSLDRLLTYAEGRQLDAMQRAALRSEMTPARDRDALLAEFVTGLGNAHRRILALKPETFSELRGVGGDMIPVPVAGLLIHCAEHTQRHAGQAVTTAKVMLAQRVAFAADTGVQVQR